MMPKLNEEPVIIDPIEEEKAAIQDRRETSDFEDFRCAHWHEDADVKENAAMTFEDFEDLANEIVGDEYTEPTVENSLLISLDSIIPQDIKDQQEKHPNPTMNEIATSEPISVNPDTDEVIDNIRGREARLFGKTEDRF